MLFTVDESRYAMATANIISVIPYVRLDKIPSASAYIAGLLNFHGEPVPVVDLSMLLAHRATNQRLSSRIVIVDTGGNGKEARIIGLLMEKATEAKKIDASEMADSGMTLAESPCLGKVYMDGDGAIQIVSAKDVLAENDVAELFVNKINNS